jgi:glycosyltransferase involved in cell wall biosynthesis
MRVLLVTHRHPPQGIGGVEIWAQELAAALLRAGHVAAVLTREGGSEASPWPPFSVVEREDAAVPGLRVHWMQHRLSDARSFRETWDDPRMSGPVGRVIDGFRPDVVHLAHPDGFGVAPLREAARRGIRSTVTLHDWKWICARGQMLREDGGRCEAVVEDRCLACVADQLDRGALRGWTARRAPRLRDRLLPVLETASEFLAKGPGSAHEAALSRQRFRTRQRALLHALLDADAVVSPSRFVAERHRAQGLTRAIEHVPNGMGVDPERAGEGARAAPPPPPSARARGPLRIGFFGTATPSKGLRELVRAVEALPPGSALLEVHGPPPAAGPGGASGPGLASGSGAASGAQSASIRYFGTFLAGDGVARMAGVDLVAIPSTWDENQPLVALEARLARRPLLVSDRGGLPELVRDGVDGWVLPAGDLAAWTERLALLAAVRARVLAAASSTAPPPSADQMASRYLTIYGASD